jgi:CubicO group peptidase (beta-lactamase class C family)
VTEQHLADLLREHASAQRVPGAAIGVLQAGKEMFAWYGTANTSTGAPVTAESRFSVGSLTKPMVATVVARLAEDGRLSLDDPVAAHVPELRSAGWAERATVRDLLANRSGLPLCVGLEFDFSARDDEDDDVLSRFAARVAEEDPTPVDWSYTNAGWCLLGRAIESVTGSVWEEAMHVELIAPAGLRETTFATESNPGARVSGHEVDADGAVPVQPLVARALGPAGASMVSTAGDMLRFAALHLADPALAALRSPQAAPRLHGWLDGWCLGWAWFEWKGGQVYGWDSVVNGERAVLRFVPELGAALVLMTNSNAGRALYRSLFSDLMQAFFEIDVPPLRLDPEPGAAGDLSRYAGVYAWRDRRMDISALESCLRIKSDEAEREALPLDDRTFVVDSTDPDNPAVTFEAFDAAGRPRVLYDMLWGLPRSKGESGS